MQHNSRRHESATQSALEARLGFSGYDDEFVVGDRVLTVDGYEGTITEAYDAPFGASYEVVLDDGIGGGEYRWNDLQRTARRYSQTPLVCDKCGRTATTSASGGLDGHTMLCPECADGRKTAARAGAPLAPQGSVETAADDYPELEDILWTKPDHIEAVPVQINNISLGSRTAKRVTAAGSGSQFDDLVEDPDQPWWWRKIVGPALQRVNDNLPPAYQTTDLTRAPSIDWCRFRRDSHCFFPKQLDEAGTREAGYPVYFPVDRGPCPRWEHDDQKACPVSEPGPNSGEKMIAPDATYAWADGGQRWDRRYSSKNAAWKDVNEKAVRIRRDGGVRIISNTGAVVTAEVHGDHGVYMTSITRVPGEKSVGVWHCSCDWSKYAWDRNGPWKKYEGRKCAHATALLYQMQADEMFGGEIEEIVDDQGWGAPKMDRREGEEPVNYGVQVYDLVTSSLTTDQKLLALGNLKDSLIALMDEQPKGERRDLLGAYVASTDHVRVRVSAPDQQRTGAFAGQVGGRIVPNLRLTPDGVYMGDRRIDSSSVLYPTFDPIAGLTASVKSPAGQDLLLGSRPAGEARTAEKQFPAGTRKCWECGGEGYIYTEGDDLGTTDVCNNCGGKGYVKDRREASKEYFDSINFDTIGLDETRYVCRDHLGSGRVMYASPEHPCHVCGATRWSEESEKWSSKTAAMNSGLEDLIEAIAANNFTHAGLIIKASTSGRVLLTQRTPFHGDDEATYGKWEFPGGGIDEGEDPLDGAIREFTEETGLTLPEGYSIDGHYVNDNYVAIVITVPDESWTVNADLLDLETMGIGWFEPDIVEGGELTRPEVERVDFDMVREATKRRGEYSLSNGGRIDVIPDGEEYWFNLYGPGGELITSDHFKWMTTDDPRKVAETAAEFHNLSLTSSHRVGEVLASVSCDCMTEYDPLTKEEIVRTHSWRCPEHPDHETADGCDDPEHCTVHSTKTAVLLDGPEPIMENGGVVYGSDDLEDVDYNELSSVAAFVPGDPRLAHLAPEAGEGSGNEDIAKAAAEFLSKQALKTFSPAEQQMLIDEGAQDHVGAANTDRLNIEGTFYESAQTDEIGFW